MDDRINGLKNIIYEQKGLPFVKPLKEWTKSDNERDMFIDNMVFSDSNSTFIED